MKRFVIVLALLGLTSCTTTGSTPQERIALVQQYIQLTCAFVPTAGEIASAIKGKDISEFDAAAQVCDIITKRRVAKAKLK